jgi:hypothetical protein
VSPKNDPDVNKEDGQSPSAHHMIGGRLVRVCQPGVHSQEIVPLFNSPFSAVYWPGDYTDRCITFYVFYEFINPSHELIFCILDKTCYQLMMTQHSVAKTYIHLFNVKLVQVPLYQSHGMAKFSTPLFISGSFFSETNCSVNTWYRNFEVKILETVSQK